MRRAEIAHLAKARQREAEILATELQQAERMHRPTKPLLSRIAKLTRLQLEAEVKAARAGRRAQPAAEAAPTLL